MTALRFDYAQALPTVDRRDDGTLRVGANLTRTGVLQYTKPDGSPWREYRPPSEVFSAESLASYGGRTVMVGHRLDAVAASTWGDVAKGDVRDDAAPAGQFVRATVQVNDARTIARILDQKRDDALSEVSCGYRCDLDSTPGVSPEGEAYDAIQRNIRLNHVALLPANRGRAGREVRLLLDSHGDALQETDLKSGMADNDYAQAQKERADALDVAAKAKQEADSLKGELAALKAEKEKLRADATASEASQPAKVAARVGLIEVARKWLPELRADSTDTDNQIKRAVIAKVNPSLKCDDNASPAYVDGVFGACVASATQDGGRKAVEAAIAAAPVQALKADAADAGSDMIAEAKARSNEFARKAWTLSTKELNKLVQESNTRVYK